MTNRMLLAEARARGLSVLNSLMVADTMIHELLTRQCSRCEVEDGAER